MHGLGIMDPLVAQKEIEKLPELTKNNIDAHMPPSFYDRGKTWISHRHAINNILGL
jgi:hypothetical protein